LRISYTNEDQNTGGSDEEREGRVAYSDEPVGLSCGRRRGLLSSRAVRVGRIPTGSHWSQQQSYPRYDGVAFSNSGGTLSLRIWCYTFTYTLHNISYWMTT